MTGEPEARKDARRGDAALTLRVADHGHALTGVRLLPGNPVRPAEFHRSGPGWQLSLPRPPLDRLEYLLELRYPGGGSKVVTDPANPREVPGPSGPKSVLEFGGYAPPAWLAAPADPGEASTLDIPAPALDAEVTVRVWTPRRTPRARRLPLLVVHDGPEYASLASLTRYLGAGVAAGWLPPLRAALLSPGQRASWYSASPRYARTLTGAVIPALTAALPSAGVIGMGASLGALSLLHAHCRRPGIFSGLFLQSGSFFAPDLDSQERGFPHYRRAPRGGRFRRDDVRCPGGEHCQQPPHPAAAGGGGLPGPAARGSGPAQLHRLARRARPAPDRPARGGGAVTGQLAAPQTKRRRQCQDGT